MGAGLFFDGTFELSRAISFHLPPRLVGVTVHACPSRCELYSV